MHEFLAHIQTALDNDTLFKITLSKKRNKKDTLKNIFVRPVKENDQAYWKTTLRYETKDITKNFTSEELVEKVDDFLRHSFFNGDLFFTNKKISLLQSKKGHAKLLENKEQHTIEFERHDHQKKRLIPEDTNYLLDLGITSSKGKVFAHAQDKYKQINKFVELVLNLIKDDTSIHTMHDMGSGKGYLTFALHDLLHQRVHSNLQSIGIEIRPDLVEKCNAIAQKNNLKGLRFELGNIQDADIPSSDIVIALHACDIATDMAIHKAIVAGAKYIVVAPCCHKQVRKAMHSTQTVLDPLLSYGIFKERQAEMITDTIRALFMESKGYKVHAMEFISSEHTGKNIMLTAKKVGAPNKQAGKKIEALKKEFGISFHYLEKLFTD